MRKLLTVLFVSFSIVAMAQTERVEFAKYTFECFYCKKTYTMPYLPVVKNIKNEKIKSSLNDQTERTMMFFSSDIKNSECMSNLNRSSQHDWRLIKTPKKVTYTATMKSKVINGETVEYADVPDWKTFDDLSGN